MQVRALRASCASFDQGNAWEAMRLATSTYIMVNDGGRNARSILTHLGIRDSISFIASGHDIRSSRNMVADTPLVLAVMQIGGPSDYVPRGNQTPELERLLSFGAWWERDYIFRSGDGLNKLTRKKLVFALRNQEGGSHYDGELTDPDYIEAAHGKTWMALSSDGSRRPLRQLELVTMRQVAWELLESLTRAGYVHS